SNGNSIIRHKKEFVGSIKIDGSGEVPDHWYGNGVFIPSVIRPGASSIGGKTIGLLDIKGCISSVVLVEGNGGVFFTGININGGRVHAGHYPCANNGVIIVLSTVIVVTARAKTE